MDTILRLAIIAGSAALVAMFTWGELMIAGTREMPL